MARLGRAGLVHPPLQLEQCTRGHERRPERHPASRRLLTGSWGELGPLGCVPGWQHVRIVCRQLLRHSERGPGVLVGSAVAQGWDSPKPPNPPVTLIHSSPVDTSSCGLDGDVAVSGLCTRGLSSPTGLHMPPGLLLAPAGACTGGSSLRRDAGSERRWPGGGVSAGPRHLCRAVILPGTSPSSILSMGRGRLEDGRFTGGAQRGQVSSSAPPSRWDQRPAALASLSRVRSMGLGRQGPRASSVMVKFCAGHV